MDLSILSAPSINLLRSLVSRTVLSSMPFDASSIATASPTMPGTFSVPARLFFSCAPPSIRFLILMPLRTYKAPTPFGP